LNADKHTPPAANEGSLGEQVARLIDELPADFLRLDELLKRVGDEGLLLLTVMMTLVFLIPVSIPGVSTVFGGAILLIGISRVSGRPLWLPKRLAQRPLATEKLRPALNRGLVWIARLERIARPQRLAALANGRWMELFNNLCFIAAALLLMAPFGFIPFSNTIPGLALLLYAIGMIQRDGGAIALGHLANIATVVYFSFLIGGGGAAAHGLWQHFSG